MVEWEAAMQILYYLLWTHWHKAPPTSRGELMDKESAQSAYIQTAKLRSHTKIQQPWFEP